MLLDALISLGLSEKEACAYMMLLRIGGSPVSSLAKRLGMKRVTTYAVLDSLAQKGYVTFQRQGSCRRYVPQDPSCILDDLERRNEELRYQLILAKDCVQKLQAFPQANSHKAKSAELFFGVEAEERMLQEIDLNQPLYLISLSHPTSPPIRLLLKSLEPWRHHLNLCVRAENIEELRSEFSFSEINEIKMEGHISGDLLVQNNKVLFISYDEQTELSVQVDAAYAALIMHLFQSSYLPHHK